MFKQRLVVYMSYLLLIAGDEMPSCMHCDEGSACFSASKCPPFSVENAGICSCNAGFFMLDDVCVTCTAGFYCAGPHTNTLRRMLSTGADIEACPGNSTSISGSDNSSLCLCNSGYTALACSEPPCDPACTACEPGTYKASVSNVVDCEPCPANTYSASSHECSPCPDSTESTAGSASCIAACGPGFTGPAGSCTGCEIGEYKNTSGSVACSSCPSGHISNGSQALCSACEPGKYALDNVCYSCPVAKYSSAYAASSVATCEYCAPGEYSHASESAHGYDTCLQCPPNSSSAPGVELGLADDQVQQQCFCDAGYAVHTGYPWHEQTRLSSEQLCQPCAAGTFQPEAVQWFEVSYDVNSTLQSCFSCPVHMTSTPGSAVCVCDVGFYGHQCLSCGEHESSAAGALSAADCHCKAGYFRTYEGCVPCAVASFRELGEGEGACTPCASGWSTLLDASNSSSLCVMCAAGSFVSEAGACTECPANSSSSAASDACQCNAGYSVDGNGCVPCSDGFFKAEGGNHACTPCPPGTQGSGGHDRILMNESCVQCPAATFWSEHGTCQSCTNNSFSLPGAVGNCTCNAGHVLSGDACVACDAGTYGLLHFAQCLPCSGAHYNPYMAATKCFHCAPNSVGGPSNTADIDCQCNRGFTGAAGGPCVLCAAGKFKSELGDAECSNCSAGAYWPAGAPASSNNCLSCPGNSSAHAPAVTFYDDDTCTCNEGFVRSNGSCSLCVPGAYCPEQHTVLACPPHSYSDSGASELAHCLCVAGFHGGNGSCTVCAVDSFCSASVSQHCPANSTTHGRVGSTNSSACLCKQGFEKVLEQCNECETDSLCANAVVVCPSHAAAAPGSRECVCTAGMRMDNNTCVPCTAQEICSDGAVTLCARGAEAQNFLCVCALGSFCAEANLSCTAGACLPCPENTWCADNIAWPCSSNSVAPANSTGQSQCKCLPGFYRVGAYCEVCSLHHICVNETRRAVTDFDPGLRTIGTGTVSLESAICAPGMFRTARTDQCKPCPKDFFCPPEIDALGASFPLPNVVRCLANEFTYNTGAQSRSECLCNAGFKLTPDSYNMRCLPCAEGERCQEGNVIETLCHLQNKVPSPNHDACVCKTGFGMYEFQCAECSAGFVKAVAGDMLCDACPDGTYALNTTSCLVCPDGASARSGSVVCVCPPPYVWTAGKCTLCADNHYWDASECKACPLPALSSPNPSMPIGSAACLCPAGHSGAPQNVSGTLLCVPCPEGQYENNSQCTLCPHAAWAPESSTSLQPNSTALSACACNSTCHGQRVDGSCAGECARPPTACTPCSAGHSKSFTSAVGNTDSCLPCAAGTYETDTGSLACQVCPENEWHELQQQSNVQACLCTAGLERRFNTSCTPCMPGHFKHWLGNELCLPCAVATYNAHVQATACSACATATGSWETLLLALGRESGDTNTLLSNLVLESNTTERDSATSVLQCVCDVGQQPAMNGNITRCQLCEPGSFKDTRSHTQCTYCGTQSPMYGHALLHHYGANQFGASDSTHCIPCPAFSGQDETLVGPHALRMSSIHDCQCFRGHENIEYVCSNCSLHMIQPLFVNTVCTHCPPGHYFVARHVQCQLCDIAQDDDSRHVGLIANARDPSLLWGDDESDCVCRPAFERNMDGMCQGCSVGKFRNSTSTRHCEMCAVDTYQDSVAQLLCKQCPLHSNTLFLMGSVVVTQCICGAGFEALSVTEECVQCAQGKYSATRTLNESSAPCLPCPENHYCPAGTSQPVACPLDEIAEAGCFDHEQCTCAPGFGRNVSSQLCTACEHGFFGVGSSNAACSKCPSNKTTMTVAATAQDNCVCIPGHEIIDNSSHTPCTPCASGFFANGLRNSKCTSCGWGTVTEPATAAENFYSCQCSVAQGLSQILFV